MPGAGKNYPLGTITKMPEWKYCKQAAQQEAGKANVECLHRLKEVAEGNKDHQRALEYKVKEI